MTHVLLHCVCGDTLLKYFEIDDDRAQYNMKKNVSLYLNFPLFFF